MKKIYLLSILFLNQLCLSQEQSTAEKFVKEFVEKYKQEFSFHNFWRKLLLIIFFGMSSMSWSQKKLLTEIKSSDFKRLENINTSREFFKKIRNDNKTIENIIFGAVGLKLNDLKSEHVKEDTLKYQGTYLHNDKEIFINKKLPIIYSIENNNKVIYFYPEKGVFLKPYLIDKQVTSPVEAIIQKTYDDIGYNCDKEHNNKLRSVNSKIFADNIKTIKKAVILNSSDAITDNSAISFTSGNANSKLNIGTNIEYNTKTFFNVNVYTSSSNVGFIYSNKAWKNNTGITFTVNKIIGNEAQFFNKRKCEEVSLKRKAFLDSIKLEINLLEKNYSHVSKKVESITSELQTLKNSTLTNEGIKKYRQLVKELTELKKETTLYEIILLDPVKFIDDKIISFDKKNNILTGSQLHWIKASIDLYNQNIVLDSMQVFTGTKINNYPKLSFDLSYNFNRNKKRLINTQLFAKVLMGNFIEATSNNSAPYIENINNSFILYDQNGIQLGRYDDLKKAFWTAQSGAQATWFFVKNFGVSGYASHTFALQKEQFTNFKNRYSLLAGLTFRINDDKDINKATFRILGGFENQLYRTNAFDNFGIKMSLGFPISLFTKNGN